MNQDRINRRDVMKTMGVAAAGLAAGSVGASAQAQSTPGSGEPKNPYGTSPGYGISLPAYYRPTLNGRPPKTRIVAIGSHGSIDAADLKAKFDACARGPS